jgi:Holliday junction resolvase
MGKTPEKEIQDAIINSVKDLEKKGHPVYYERRDASGLSYKKGLPDIFVVYKGLHVEVEIKSLSGSRSSLQETWARYFESIGTPYILAKSKDDFLTQLSEIINIQL